MEVLPKTIVCRNESIASLCVINRSAFPSEDFSNDLNLS
jgi:hypothetical protein